LLEHGGNLRQAALEYDIPLEDWLDLSTGINPNGWSVPNISAAAWQQLPQDNDGLELSAQQYYGAPSLLAVAGSQAAIQVLPRLRPQGTVGILSLSYAEHRHNWQQQGHKIIELNVDEIESHLSELDVLLLVNPNNPTGIRYTVSQLLLWHTNLAERNGWLVVDEAFMDSTPENSLSHFSDRPGLIVLRSLGKFFGLAGVRCGFVLAEKPLLEQLREYLGPWTLPGPSREVAQQVLCDINWQITMRDQLRNAGERLKDLLECYSLNPEGDVDLFKWFKHPAAKLIQSSLARQGILVRYFDKPASLRLGLPKTEKDWVQLDVALENTIHEIRGRKITNESMAV